MEPAINNELEFLQLFKESTNGCLFANLDDDDLGITTNKNLAKYTSSGANFIRNMI